MKIIDNNGLGNCMYYAYSISLMYYLRSTKNKAVIDAILNLFPVQKHTLQEIIARNKNKLKPFDTEDTDTIQQLLGTACRTFASRSVKEEFLINPNAAQITHTAIWKFTDELKKYVNPDIFKSNMIVSIGDDITEAELFKVNGLNLAMTAYAQKNAKKIEMNFYQQWSKFSPEEQHNTNKMILRESIINHITVEFFTHDDNNYLNQYINHLNTNSTWGSAETLATFHNALVNLSGVPIQLSLLADGAYTDRSDLTRTLEIVMNNYNNTHWVSVIPNQFLIDKPTASYDEKALLSKALNNINDANIKNSYKSALSKMVKQMIKFGLISNITNIDTATAQVSETDEDFAKRLQMAEIELLCKIPSH